MQIIMLKLLGMEFSIGRLIDLLKDTKMLQSIQIQLSRWHHYDFPYELKTLTDKF